VALGAADAAGARCAGQVMRLPGAKHAFTRPEKTSAADDAAGMRFDRAAADRAWAAASALLGEELRG
jgi:dienelactone hydrolase